MMMEPKKAKRQSGSYRAARRGEAKRLKLDWHKLNRMRSKTNGAIFVISPHAKAAG
jgi:hypothetical protein